MYAFSAQIEIPAGATLAGFSDRIHAPTLRAGSLEVHGIGDAAGDGWQVCAVDALYAGVLADTARAGIGSSVIAASHTHYAPLLDPTKPALGLFSEPLAALYAEALRGAPRQPVVPDSCTLMVGRVDIPIYRRFDFPQTKLNRLLARRAGLYPNEAHPIDRNVYLFAFAKEGRGLFSIVYHACHPVTRHDGKAASADYVSALRQAVAARLGPQPCLFFLGCAGDIRPNLAQKRTRLLPRSRLNWKFRPEPREADEMEIDAQYRLSIESARTVARFSLADGDIRLNQSSLAVRGLGPVSMPQLDIGQEVSFSFLPFEVSHRYQLEVAAMPQPPRRFVVSCADTVHGYLPHPDQLRAGGYEVEASRALMGLANPISIDSRDLWPTK